jgi:hypothetical protein
LSYVFFFSVTSTDKIFGFCSCIADKQLCPHNAPQAGSAEQLHTWAFQSWCLLSIAAEWPCVNINNIWRCLFFKVHLIWGRGTGEFHCPWVENFHV